MGVRGETSIEGQGKVGWNIPGGLEVLGGGYFVTRKRVKVGGEGGRIGYFWNKRKESIRKSNG